MHVEALEPKEKMMEKGLILENQASHWIEGKISVKIDIEITGNGRTVSKWQAKQYSHKTAVYNNMASLEQEIIMLHHSNMGTKGMDVK